MQVEEKIIRQIKASIAGELEEKGDGSLPDDSILVERVAKVRTVPPMYASTFYDCTESEFLLVNWDVVLRRLREEVMVRLEKGSGIVDDNESYDKDWFSKRRLVHGSDFYYWDRFSDYYSNRLGPQVRYTIARDTESILNLCGDPRRLEARHIRGLVFGFVQSGKTINYLSVANAAMDSGYDIVVILAGATNILRRQTQERLNLDIIGQLGEKPIGVGTINFQKDRKPISLTTLKSDFNRNVAEAQMSGFTLHTAKTPVVAVLKKNVSPLKHLKKWLTVQSGGGLLEKSILLIDDESDYASVNTREEEDPTSINKGIRDILKLFSASTYLAVTATPFANILIDHEGNNDEQGSDLFPRSFIWALEKPETYVGVKETLGDGFVNVLEIPRFNRVDLETEVVGLLTAKKEQAPNMLPVVIKNAVCRFFYDATRLRESRPETDHLSMLVNVSRFTDHHIALGALVNSFIQELFKQIRCSTCANTSNEWLLTIKQLASADYGEFQSLDAFWFALEKNLAMSQVFDIHQKSQVELTYPRGLKRNSLLIGGLTLSRGYTVEGLITSIFIRTTRTFDALMQMGRWFGHKRHYVRYISVHTIPSIQKRFMNIEDATLDLLVQIKEMKEARQAPVDFGLNIKRHPNVTIEHAIEDAIDRARIEVVGDHRLDVVARNKQKAASLIELKLSLSNRCMETVRLLPGRSEIEFNNSLVCEFWDKIINSYDSVSFDEWSDSKLYVDGAETEVVSGFLNVPHTLVRDFVIDFKLPKQSLSDTTSKLPLRFLEDYLNDPARSQLKWDVSIVSSSRANDEDTFEFYGRKVGKVTRSFELARDGQTIKIPKNQLSIPSNEFRFLPVTSLSRDEDFKNRNRAREIRKRNGNKPLLLLFPIAPDAAQGADDLDLSGLHGVNLWGWTISMPGANDDGERVVVLANKVYQKEIEELFALEHSNGDEDGDD
jgi:hypothetical protein